MLGAPAKEAAMYLIRNRALFPYRLLMLGLFACSLWLVSRPANAQALGRSGDFVVNAERLFGAYATRQEVDDPGGFVVRDTSIGFLTHRRPGSILTSPRVGFDYFVARSFSIGGVVAVYSGDIEDSGFLLAPRVGYALPFNNRWGFWPRGGLTFSSENEPDRTQIALSV